MEERYTRESPWFWDDTEIRMKNQFHLAEALFAESDALCNSKVTAFDERAFFGRVLEIIRDVRHVLHTWGETEDYIYAKIAHNKNQMNHVEYSAQSHFKKEGSFWIEVYEQFFEKDFMPQKTK